MDKRSTVIVPQYIYGEGSGERRERGSSCGKSRHYKADNEKCRHKASCWHKTAPSHCGEQFVRAFHGKAVKPGELIEVHSKKEEQRNHNRLHQGGHNEVLL